MIQNFTMKLNESILMEREGIFNLHATGLVVHFFSLLTKADKCMQMFTCIPVYSIHVSYTTKGDTNLQNSSNGGCCTG